MSLWGFGDACMSCRQAQKAASKGALFLVKAKAILLVLLCKAEKTSTDDKRKLMTAV